MTDRSSPLAPRGGKPLLATRSPGTLIAIEGAPGTGKTTQVRLLAEHLQSLDCDAMVADPPAETASADGIDFTAATTPTGLLLLLAAVRAEQVACEVNPALQRGAVVIADGYTDTGRAVASASTALSPMFIESLIQNIRGSVVPHARVLLRSPNLQDPLAQRAQRLLVDRAALASRDWTVIDTDASIERTHQAVVEAVASIIDRARAAA